MNLAGPIVGVWYLIGFVVMVYLLMRERANLDNLSESLEPEEAAAPVAA